MTQSNAYFEQKLDSTIKGSVALQKEVQTLSWLRVISFVTFLIVFIALANLRELQLMILSFLLFVPIFGILVRRHNHKKFAFEQLQHLISINQNEIKRQEGNLSDLDDGAEFLDLQHDYAPDLDVFGSNSLFQLLVRSKLAGTRDTLKNWLLTRATKEEIVERQEAIQELQTDHEWRQNLTAYGYHGDQKDKKYSNVVLSLLQWIDDNLGLMEKFHWRLLRYLMPMISTAFIGGIVFFDLPFKWIFIMVPINLLLLSVIFKPLMNVTKEFGNMSAFLKGYENVILEIESKSFTSPLLRRQHNLLHQNDQLASDSIKSLRRILMFLLNRANFLYQLLNLFFLLDINWLMMAFSWKKKYINQVAQWFDAVHHIDAINDLASYSFANPDYVFPDLSTSAHHLTAKDLGHPLIKPVQRVSNDFELSGRGKLGLVTGSNMSGKSTFLRTIGVNLVLAQMGAPVCASRFEFSLCDIFTSMRTQDNLEESVSSFYAELKRLKSLLDKLQDDHPVFYLLDEILKGTNSEDRHKGAVSLINQLINENCRGLISTHDIHLSSLAGDKSEIENMSFNSTIVDDEIIFDYKLTLTPCTSFNASKLMEKMGIIKK